VPAFKTVARFRVGGLQLEANGWSPKKWSVIIGRNKRYPDFGYTPRNKWAWAFAFFVDEKSMWNSRWHI
jgi:hypothetical protein